MKENPLTTPRQVNLQEGQKKIQKYIFSLNNVLGKGSYATVYLGRRVPDDLPTAVKVIDKKIFANTYNIRSIQSQIQIMKKVDHKNIVRLLDVYQTANNMYIVTEFCKNGDLKSFIKKQKKLSEGAAIKVLRNIVDGFQYLHEMEVIHRDLKPANLLLHKGVCKISDFGFAKNLEYGESTVMRSIVGTPLYMSPQILNKESYTNKSDLWSLGLIFYEMIYGHTPWPAQNELQLLNNIMTRPIPFDSSISVSSKDFIKKCLKVKEDDRMSWDEAFSHPLIKGGEEEVQKILRDFSANKQNKNRIKNQNRSKSKSIQKKNFLSRNGNFASKSPLKNMSPLKPTRCDETPIKKSPWKF